jgi:hypothetical protein
MLAGVVILYCLTSPIDGFTAVRLFRQMHGKNWLNCSLLTTAFFPAPVVAVFTLTNWVAAAHGSTRALPFYPILTCLALYLFTSFPLTLVGGFLAKDYASDRTVGTPNPRVLTAKLPWNKRRLFQGCVAGFVPFAAIYIELHYIFTSMWSHEVSTFFGIPFLAFILLVILTSILTVTLLSYRRNDHWWWETYINGGMTGIFIYVYSFYFYFYRSEMKGLLQGSFYFKYMFIISLACFLVLGSAGFQSSLVYVRYVRSQGHTN